jgi:acyl-CoA dehydrogenase
MAFFQDPPRLAHAFHDDRVLRSYLTRALPEDARREAIPALEALGELASGELFERMIEHRASEPRLVTWDAWGHRVDRIEVTPTWKEARKIACEAGLVGTPYEGRLGEHARPVQAALIYLFHPSTDTYTCPLAMTDGAARTLLAHRNTALIDRAVARLVSRRPDEAWTSGQWMTERTGGSDVGLTETVARKDESGSYRLYGTKWFTSAITSEMALTLARPEGNGPGSRGLALFYLETRDEHGHPNGLLVNRLKDKLGTRKLPTAELTLDGALATPVVGLSDGVRAIAPMLNITRYWNSVCAISGMRRGLALARDYARRRRAFGATLSERPLHLDTLADVQAEFEAAFHLVLFTAELLGREEAGVASDEETRLLRLVTPLAKLTTGKQTVAAASEILEAFGGAGYVEDTGLPALLRDAQVLPIWEGTTNVLSLDVLRVVAKEGSLPALLGRIEALVGTARDTALAEAGASALAAARHAAAWLGEGGRDPLAVEAGARRFALTLGRSMELAALVRHAQWSIDHEHDGRARAAAVRFARHGVDLLGAGGDLAGARALANDEALGVE